MFSDTLDEFDDSRQVVQDLIEEYEACETPDYVNYVSAIDFGNADPACYLTNSFGFQGQNEMQTH
jgi:hypothetical protein